jgi:hypothetical protein
MLHHVDDQVEADEEHRQHQSCALQDRQIPGEDRAVQQKAGAGPREHGLDQDRAADQIAELQAHHGKADRCRIFDHVSQHLTAP